MIKKAKILIGFLILVILIGVTGFTLAAELFPKCPVGRQWDPELEKCVTPPKPAEPGPEPGIEPETQPEVKPPLVEERGGEYTRIIIIAGIVIILILILVLIWYRFRKK